jgi:CubicO group peptidase (beta-lactamase class C family)
MQREVLVPLGMTHSTYQQPLPADQVDHAAFGHRAKRTPIAGNFHTYPEMAAAGLWTTPSDLALAVIDVARAANSQPGTLLKKETVDEMLTPVKSKMGLGLVVEGEGRKRRFSHGGANEGYRCQMLCFPATGQGLVIMTNSDTGGAMFGKVLEQAAKTYAWP